MMNVIYTYILYISGECNEKNKYTKEKTLYNYNK